MFSCNCHFVYLIFSIVLFVSGFVFGLFGKVPVKYEKISWNEYEFIIHDMEGHRINMVKISKNEDSEEVNEE